MSGTFGVSLCTNDEQSEAARRGVDGNREKLHEFIVRKPKIHTRVTLCF
jgi:hypothetical protein